MTYIEVEDVAILGFVTASPSEIEIDALPADRRRWLPRYPLPTLRLARLAVAEYAQGRGVSRTLLRFALSLARRMADEMGCVGVVVDAKPKARTFYLRYGFESMTVIEGMRLDRPEPTPMFLPLSSIPCPDTP